MVGESGCGKSTLARLVVGLYRPSTGRVSIDGTDLARLRTRAQLAPAAPPHADDLPGSLCQPEPALGVCATSSPSRSARIICSRTSWISASGSMIFCSRSA
ncbi:MAG: ATP-binding cassette domain-containing protein [Aliidongia sp.]